MPKASVWLLCLALLAPALLPAQSSVRTTPRALALTHVTVIDATGTAAKPDMTVVITGDRITGLGTFGRIAIPQDAQVIAASGKFLIPGLWDMHSHTAIDAAMKETRLPLLIANGITGVRDMAGLLDAIKQWRREIAAGTLLGPRFVAAGPLLDGPGSIYGPGTKSSKGLGDNGYVVVSTAVAGREDVDELKRDGADFIKVYDRLSRDTYYAIADEAKKQSIPFAGHVPYAVTAAEA
ncbi:MAG: amidohydrolase family protein, partial [Steroidobacteraceae bacterium]